MFGLGMGELTLILLLGILLFGKQLPNMARSVGKSVSEFRREAQAIREDVSTSVR